MPVRVPPAGPKPATRHLPDAGVPPVGVPGAPLTIPGLPGAPLVGPPPGPALDTLPVVLPPESVVPAVVPPAPVLPPESVVPAVVPPGHRRGTGGPRGRAMKRGGRGVAPTGRSRPPNPPSRANRRKGLRRMDIRPGIVVPGRPPNWVCAARRSSSGTASATPSSCWCWHCRRPSCSTCRSRGRPGCGPKPPGSSKSPTSSRRCAATSSTAPATSWRSPSRPAH